MACRTGCPTQDHASWGACARAASLRVAFCGAGGLDATRQKNWDAELQAYRDARRQGIQPDSTKMPAIRRAERLSQEAGAAYGRDFSLANPM